MANFLFNSKGIHYLEKGKGELLIILPGNTASSVVHQEQLDYYSQFFFAVCIDFLGAGKSDRLTEIIDDWWRYLSEQVYALIRHLNVEKAIVLGVSGGAIIGMYLASKYPDQVKALILDSFSSRFTEDMLNRNIINERSAPNDFQKQFWKYCHGDDWLDVVKYDTEIFRKMVEKGGDWIEDCHKKIICPVLLIGSRADVFIPQIETDYSSLALGIKNCRITISEEGNHPLIWTNPEFFNERVMSFLRNEL